MGRKRERLEIIYDILKSVQREKKIKPTKLLHYSNLSPQMFKIYLKELLEKDFIQELKEKNKKFFVLSEKGTNFLVEYKTISNFISNFGL